MSRLFVLILILVSSTSAGPDYGQAKAQGNIHLSTTGVELIVARGTKSEATIHLSGKRTVELMSFSGRKLIIEGKVLRPIENQRGEIEVTDFSLPIPNALDSAQGDGIQLQKAKTNLHDN